MRPSWAADTQAIEEILARYPKRRSAIMPLLHRARETRGYVAGEDIAAVAEILELTPAEVESVASFYALYYRHPTGKYVLTVCGNLSCVLGGAPDLARHLQQRLGVRPGETTPDGLFTLEVTGECLAACDQAPVLQVNGYYVHRVSAARADRLLQALRDGVPMAAMADRAGLPDEAPPEGAAAEKGSGVAGHGL